jgi:CarD family transcriptional regulator
MAGKATAAGGAAKPAAAPATGGKKAPTALHPDTSTQMKATVAKANPVKTVPVTTGSAKAAAKPAPAQPASTQAASTQAASTQAAATQAGASQAPRVEAARPLKAVAKAMPVTAKAEAAPTPAAATPAAPAAAPRPAPSHHRPAAPVHALPASSEPAPSFAVGDHVVYPTHGVGRVTGVVNEEIAGHKLTLIVIEFEENRMVLRVPVAKARTAGLRKLSTRKAIDTALATLKGRARVKRTMWSRRAQEYEAKINSGDPVAIAEVVRDLHRNAGQPDQSFSERQIYEQAMDRLAAELAAIDGIDKPAAQAKLATVLKAA